MKVTTSDDVAGGLLVMLGIAALRLIRDDAFERFVRPGMRTPLIIAGLFLLILGMATIVKSWRGRPDSHHEHGCDNDPSHDGHHHSRVGWLLAVPVLVLLLVAPAPLGSYAARRSVNTTELPQTLDLGAPPLPETDGAIHMSLGKYSEWALYDRNESLKDKRVRLIGFVTADEEAPGGYFLTRFRIACCAADALVIQIGLHGDLPPLTDDTWITVYGTWKPTKLDPGGNKPLRPQLTVESIAVLNDKPGPYELPNE
jgi:uncharacterized repeat protein (TIGR03943 family)